MPLSLKSRLLISLVVGVIAGVVVGVRETTVLGVLVGIATTATVKVVTGWLVLWPLDATATESNMGREDFRPVGDEVIVVVAALGGLGATVSLLVSHDDSRSSLAAAVALLGVFMSWAALHLMYATHYAHLYYDESDCGIDWNQPGHQPAFRDFLYFSYNLGMTYQVSDTAVKGATLRSVVLRHCLLSYVFGAAILATTINLVAGVLTG